ncbi:HAD-IA family hydrolase [Loktanella sp. SALINAS62]|uniref:HAD-IA family hydrolase n=1 Tax=Loktanella sp. SALINAS62 TaxID=2706124 RepID=UPI001B8BAD48|nr:HAD-IA family hydrolase [Loktanella sp. SALINAS62]MBS1301450.1 HAD-IA family hydrolase [Loktanella sp. SALINAS62]
MPSRLVILDVDGTLVDSRAAIIHAMRAAFVATDLPYPGDAACLRGVGLSIGVLFAALVPGADQGTLDRLSVAYKQAFHDQRVTMGSRMTAPFFAGALDALNRLRACDDTLLAIATGKSRRGLDSLVADHGLAGYFASVQTADDHPSKPHPAMILQALAETGVVARHAVMVGDTTFDMDMARPAGVSTIGVTWGYHAVDLLAADKVITDFAQLDAAVDALTGVDA